MMNIEKVVLDEVMNYLSDKFNIEKFSFGQSLNIYPKTKETMHRELVERRGELSNDFLESESETQNDAERATNDVNENAETTASEANIENSVAADSQSDETQDNE